MKDVKDFGVQELNFNETKNANGGFWVELWGGINFARLNSSSVLSWDDGAIGYS
ncbi:MULTISPECIES: hypothetical protein [Aquimarina]|uniref:hypothetical protein n=1 Tax=Aquimarina TaxID=290174 RepID=UPI00135940C3|nr:MULTISPECIES: hypothetical protein [Aquimarina]